MGKEVYEKRQTPAMAILAWSRSRDALGPVYLLIDLIYSVY
jgi:hypothetical protein